MTLRLRGAPGSKDLVPLLFVSGLIPGFLAVGFTERIDIPTQRLVSLLLQDAGVGFESVSHRSCSLFFTTLSGA